jgi:hypothetical protein
LEFLIGDEELNSGDDNQGDKENVGCDLEIQNRLRSGLLLEDFEYLLLLFVETGVLVLLGKDQDLGSCYQRAVL